MRHYACLFFLAYCCLFTTDAFGQNGWTRKANSFYAQASASHFSSKNFYNTSGQFSDAGSTFNSSGLLLYGEYGITDRFTGVLDVPIIMLNSFNTTETVAGPGSVKLGLKYALVKKIPIALQVDFDIPTDDGVKLAKVKEQNPLLGTIEQINLPVSDGEFNIWTTLAVSQALKNGKTFGSLYGSVNFRTESFSNQLQVGLEVGHLFFDNIYLIGKLKIQESLESENSQASASFLYGEGTTFTSYNLTTMYKLNEHWNIVASFSDFSGAIVKRRNIYDGGTYSLGVALEY